MTKRRLLLIGATVVAVVMFYACSGKEEPGNGGVDGADSGDAPSTDGAPTYDTFRDDTLGVDGEAPDDGGAIDGSVEGSSETTGVDAGEYCPSPSFPPRTDGCHCIPPGTSGTSDKCRESELGRTCDYFQNCPSGPGDRYTCQWYFPTEADAGPYTRWTVTGIACSGG